MALRKGVGGGKVEGEGMRGKDGGEQRCGGSDEE